VSPPDQTAQHGSGAGRRNAVSSDPADVSAIGLGAVTSLRVYGFFIPYLWRPQPWGGGKLGWYHGRYLRPRLIVGRRFFYFSL